MKKWVVCLSVLTIFLAGCGSGGDTAKTVHPIPPEHDQKLARAYDFLKQLEATPQEQRAAFVKSHGEDYEFLLNNDPAAGVKATNLRDGVEPSQ